MKMKKVFRQTISFFVVFVILTGGMYPLLITGFAALVFPWQAVGSPVTGKNGEIIGSKLIGQEVSNPAYFWGRPSATAEYPYNAQASGASNLSVLNPILKQQVNDRMAHLKAADPENSLPVPVDLVTASASGLDPDISPAAAYYQAHRVAAARGLPDQKVRDLIAAHIEKPFLLIFGEPRVNVLLLNLALDSVQ
jgi:potassium-transporting ATPase KdpC subunit